jgi:DNA-binding SARP family transcriptional activator
MAEIEFRLLGPVQVWIDRKSVHIGPPLRRTILAVLLVEANRLISTERIVDAIWGERPPPAARDVLASHIARLRHTLAATGAHLPRGSAGGYRLEVGTDLIDLHRFRGLLRRSHAATSGPDANTMTRGALDLWRGEPFTGTVGPWLPQVAASLTQQWLAAFLDHADWEMSHGRAHLVVDELVDLAARFPLDEKLLAAQMIALSDTGRRSDALLCFENTRRRLADELGVDPSHALQATHRAIINGGRPVTAANPTGSLNASPNASPAVDLAAVASVVQQTVRAEIQAICAFLTEYLATPHSGRHQD